jgi:predicted homoserine dehydrogenase-like protein
MDNIEESHNIGIVGTGFIARGLISQLKRETTLNLSSVLTRRNLSHIQDLSLPDGIVTNSLIEISEKSDIAIVSTGDPVYNTEVIRTLLESGVKVITMDSETQVTTGSWLSQFGFLTEAEGDQPGSLAALNREVRDMGFIPLVYGNIKGFLNHSPSRAEMDYWSKKSGITITQVTSFTDGTKIQIEQTLVANGLDAEITKQGLEGINSNSFVEGAQILGNISDRLAVPISDYVLTSSGPPGIFIVAKHNEDQMEYLRYYKMGDGPHYVLTKPFHLCHLEVLKTIRSTIHNRSPYAFNNSKSPRISVGAIAKRDMNPGEIIERGIGSFDVRGEALRIVENKTHIPIGLIYNTIVRRPIKSGQLIRSDDVEVPESLALIAWDETLANLVEQ